MNTFFWCESWGFHDDEDSCSGVLGRGVVVGYHHFGGPCCLHFQDDTQECIHKFPDWPPGARTANGTDLCHYVQLYRYFVSLSSEFCRHKPLCWFSTSVYCCKRIFRYRLSPETFGYTLVLFHHCTVSQPISRLEHGIFWCVIAVVVRWYAQAHNAMPLLFLSFSEWIKGPAGRSLVTQPRGLPRHVYRKAAFTRV
jgi:hypothetical protein